MLKLQTKRDEEAETGKRSTNRTAPEADRHGVAAAAAARVRVLRLDEERSLRHMVFELSVGL